LDSLTALFSSAPVLVASEQREPLLLYPAVTTHMVSAALIEWEEPSHALKVQWLVFLSVKYSPTPRLAPRRCISSYMVCLWQLRSCSTISPTMRSPLSPHSCSRRSSTATTLQDGSTNGGSSSWATTSSRPPAVPSSRRPWPTSWPNGRRSKPILRTSSTNTGPYTLMGRSWDVAVPT
jgi:hypothetical protein